MLVVEENGAGDGDFVVNAALGIESFDLVMKKRIFLPVFPAGGATDNHDGRFFGIGAGDGVENVKSTDAIGDTDQADAVQARISIGGEASAGLVGHRNVFDLGFFEPRECGESEIARNAKAVTDAAAVEVFEEELTQGHGGRKRLESDPRGRSVVRPARSGRSRRALRENVRRGVGESNTGACW